MILTNSVILPTIHLGGTSGEVLFSALREAITTLREAEDMLREVEPNGRDYYPQGPSAYAGAAEEHRSRLRRVASVRDELQAIAEHVLARIEERKARVRP